jgi:hypothetical protein
MEIEHKWCGGLSKENLKHKLYMAHNLWEEAPLPPYSIFFDSLWGLHPNGIYSETPKWKSQKLGLLLF